MIRLEQVSRSYPGGIMALAEVSAAIAPGEFVVLSGHSGAGKSTLVKLLAGLERPSRGSVHIGEQDVGRLSRAALPFLRRKLGVVFQDQKLLFDRNVRDNVMLPLEIGGFAREEAKGRVAAALERVGLAGREGAMPIQLSGGEQQRLAIARAIVHKPAVLIADEPTAHLDIDYARDIAALFGSFHQAGVTIVLATHDSALFAPWKPRRIALAHGRLAEAAP